ncbi:MAG: helix-turn-helix domain-containing protein [Kiritimatiellae bacterium]|nr:helix-turn-helix domain-containing protein [Kiritimatiellia bacterium]
MSISINAKAAPAKFLSLHKTAKVLNNSVMGNRHMLLPQRPSAFRPWRKLAIIPGTSAGFFELQPGQKCGSECFRDFDVWIGLAGQAVAHLLGHKIELQKDRMIFIPPGVTICLRGKADQRLRMIYSHFDCLVSGRPVRDARSAVNAADLTLALRGLPAVALVADIDSESVSRKLTQARTSYSADLAELTLTLIYLEIWRRLRETYLSPRDTLSARRLEKTVNYFESRLEKGITLEEVARHVSVSSETLERLFRVHYRTTPMHYLSRLRLLKARDLLYSGRYQISEAAYAAGFKSPQYFSRVFKRVYGMAPVDFVKQRTDFKRGEGK